MFGEARVFVVGLGWVRLVPVCLVFVVPLPLRHLVFYVYFRISVALVV